MPCERLLWSLESWSSGRLVLCHVILKDGQVLGVSLSVCLLLLLLQSHEALSLSHIVCDICHIWVLFRCGICPIHSLLFSCGQVFNANVGSDGTGSMKIICPWMNCMAMLWLAKQIIDCMTLLRSWITGHHFVRTFVSLHHNTIRQYHQAFLFFRAEECKGNMKLLPSLSIWWWRLLWILSHHFYLNMCNAQVSYSFQPSIAVRHSHNEDFCSIVCLVFVLSSVVAFPCESNPAQVRLYVHTCLEPSACSLTLLELWLVLPVISLCTRIDTVLLFVVENLQGKGVTVSLH